MAANMKMLSTAVFLIFVVITDSQSTRAKRKLSEKSYTTIKSEDFSNSTDITHLDLSNKSIRVLPEAVFSSLKNLRHLNVSGNSIEKTTNSFVGLNNLVDLDISNNALSVVGSNFFNGLTSQCRINLKNNNHSLTIRGDAFGSKRLRTRNVLVKANASVKSNKSLSEPVEIILQMCTRNSIFEELKIFHGENEPENNCQLVAHNDMVQLSLMNVSSVKKGWYKMTRNDARSANISGIFLFDVKSPELIRDFVNELPRYFTKVTVYRSPIDRLTNGTFRHNSVVDLNLNFNEINVIEIDAIDMPKLKTLSLWGNRLNNTDALKGFPATLEKLILKYNEIKALTTRSFSHLKNLKSLSIIGNGIAKIEPGAFENLDNLETLDMWNNKLTRIDPGVFATLKIKTLDFGENRLHDFSSLARLPSTIETLYLSSNNFTAITTGALSHLKNLRYLRLKKNQISTIAVGAFEHLEKLERLRLSSNRISKLEARVFNGLKNLRILSLDHNSLARIDADIFDLPKLQILEVSHNSVTAIAKGALKNSPRLCYLDIGENLINKLRNGELFGFQKLSSCSVNVTGIETLEGGVFDNV